MSEERPVPGPKPPFAKPAPRRPGKDLPLPLPTEPLITEPLAPSKSVPVARRTQRRQKGPLLVGIAVASALLAAVAILVAWATNREIKEQKPPEQAVQTVVDDCLSVPPERVLALARAYDLSLGRPYAGTQAASLKTPGGSAITVSCGYDSSGKKLKTVVMTLYLVETDREGSRRVLVVLLQVARLFAPHVTADDLGALLQGRVAIVDERIEITASALGDMGCWTIIPISNR